MLLCAYLCWKIKEQNQVLWHWIVRCIFKLGSFGSQLLGVRHIVQWGRTAAANEIHKPLKLQYLIWETLLWKRLLSMFYFDNEMWGCIAASKNPNSFPGVYYDWCKSFCGIVCTIRYTQRNPFLCIEWKFFFSLLSNRVWST